MLVLQRQHYYFIIVTIGSIRTALFPSICICVMKQSIVMEASNMINEIRRDHLYIIENVSNKMRRRMPKGQDEKQRNLTQSSSSPCCCYICINVSYVGSDFSGKYMESITITELQIGGLQKDYLLLEPLRIRYKK